MRVTARGVCSNFATLAPVTLSMGAYVRSPQEIGIHRISKALKLCHPDSILVEDFKGVRLMISVGHKNGINI